MWSCLNSYKTPGDFAYYTFKIKNEGNFDAKISSLSTPLVTMSAIGFEKGIYCVAKTSEGVAYKKSDDILAMPLNNAEKDIEGIKVRSYSDEEYEGIEFCSKYITYSLTYTNGGNNVAVGDIFLAGEEKDITMKISYSDNVPSSALPTYGVDMPQLNTTIGFEQK